MSRRGSRLGVLVRLKPIGFNADLTALALSGSSLETLASEGTEPEHVMRMIDDWLRRARGHER
jgi:hypothetical protein